MTKYLDIDGCKYLVSKLKGEISSGSSGYDPNKKLEDYSWKELNDLAPEVIKYPADWSRYLGQTKWVYTNDGSLQRMLFQLVGICTEGVDDTKNAFTFRCIGSYLNTMLRYSFQTVPMQNWSKQSYEESTPMEFIKAAEATLTDDMKSYIKPVKKPWITPSNYTTGGDLTLMEGFWIGCTLDILDGLYPPIATDAQRINKNISDEIPVNELDPTICYLRGYDAKADSTFKYGAYLDLSSGKIVQFGMNPNTPYKGIFLPWFCI